MQFRDRFSGADDFYKYNDDVEPDPVRGLAMRRRISYPTRSIAICRWTIAARRASAVSKTVLPAAVSGAKAAPASAWVALP